MPLTLLMKILKNPSHLARGTSKLVLEGADDRMMVLNKTLVL